MLVERLVQCNSPKLKHIETSKACRRKRRNNAFRRYAKLVIEQSRALRKVDGDGEDWGGGKLGSKRGLSPRPRQVAVETPGRFDLKASQHDFLQPRRIVRLQPARRNGIAPEPPAHPVHRLAVTEGP